MELKLKEMQRTLRQLKSKPAEEGGEVVKKPAKTLKIPKPEPSANLNKSRSKGVRKRIVVSKTPLNKKSNSYNKTHDIEFPPANDEYYEEENKMNLNDEELEGQELYSIGYRQISYPAELEIR